MKIFRNCIIYVSLLALLSGCAAGSTPTDSSTASEGSTSAPSTTVPTQTTAPTQTTDPTQSTAPSTIPPTSAPPVATPPATKPVTKPTDPPVLTKAEKIARIIESMTLEQKISQLFIVTAETLNNGKRVTSATSAMKDMLTKYPVGGIIFYEYNLKDPDQTKTMLKELQAAAQIELFTCVDEEGGRVAKVANNPDFGITNVGAMNKITSEEQAYNAGKTMGKYLRELGFNFNFAPVADPTTDGIESHVEDRSFGNDPAKVAAYAAAVTRGLTENDVLSSFKHYPGNGASATDPHLDFAFTSKTEDELRAHDLIPFMQAQKNKVPAIMVAHISVPSVIGDHTPSSLSHKMITEMLREEFGYQGLILTDALNMGAISKNYGADEAAVMALKAGNDILLMPNNFESAFNAVKSAVENGEITHTRLEESLTRILSAKID